MRFLLGLVLFSVLPATASAREKPFASAVEKLAKSIAEQLPPESKIVVGNIFDRDNKTTYLGRYLSDKLQAELVGQPKITILERDRRSRRRGASRARPIRDVAHRARPAEHDLLHLDRTRGSAGR